MANNDAKYPTTTGVSYPVSQLIIAGFPNHHLYFPRWSWSWVLSGTGGPYNFSVPTGEDQYFVTNFAVLGVLKSGGPDYFFWEEGR